MESTVVVVSGSGPGAPVVVLVRLRGEHGALLPTLDGLHAAQAATQPAEGLVLHSVCTTDEGVLMVDLWRSRDDYRVFIAAAEARRGHRPLPLPTPEIEIHEVRALLGSPNELIAAIQTLSPAGQPNAIGETPRGTRPAHHAAETM